MLLMDGSTQTKLESAQDIPKQVLITKKLEWKTIKFKFFTLFQKNGQKWVCVEYSGLKG